VDGEWGFSPGDELARRGWVRKEKAPVQRLFYSVLGPTIPIFSDSNAVDLLPNSIPLPNFRFCQIWQM
jgi:hypothetical protein